MKNNPIRSTHPTANLDPNEAERQSPIALNDIVEQNLDMIVQHHIQAERNVDYHQRNIEKIMGMVGRPRFLYAMIGVVACWILLQLLLPLFGHPSFDPPPFYWLQGTISFSALCVTIMVLTTQNRLEVLHERRRHLDLQVTLLTEQEVTKVIRLLEELRRDTPFIQNRSDPEADAMQQGLDAHNVMQGLDEMFHQKQQDEQNQDEA